MSLSCSGVKGFEKSATFAARFAGYVSNDYTENGFIEITKNLN